MSTDVDLTPPQIIHIVGVGGAGMSAIAGVLAAMGHTVSGSDLKASKALDRLASQGLRVAVGHDAAHLDDAAVVARSTAIGDRNPEVVAARERGLPVLRRSEVLAAITDLRRTISVAGTHGKTTTSSMLAVVLAEAGLDPSFIIGGDVHQIGSGAVWSDGDWFVVEADESDGTFVELTTEVAVVTNVEPDHHAHYGDFAALRDAFDHFVEGASGIAVVGVDDVEGSALAERHPAAVTVGEAEGASYRIVDLTREPLGTTFHLHRGRDDLGRIHLPVPGAHNARNAAVAAATALEVGASFDAVAVGAGPLRRRGPPLRVPGRDRRRGLRRRLRPPADRGRRRHRRRSGHRPGSPGRRVPAPPLHAGCDALAAEFGPSFVDADLVVVTDVYSAGETPIPGVSGMAVVTAVKDEDPERQVEYHPRREDLVANLLSRLRPGDLCLTLGAGDLTTLPDELQAALAAREVS